MAEPARGRAGFGHREEFAFVGRRQELGSLTIALRRGPTVVLVEGEAGVGKSRLLREAAAYARREGITVLQGWCHPLREPLPFGPVVDALRQAVALIGPDTALSPTTAVLAPYLPELAGLLPTAIGVGAGEPHQQLMRAVHDVLGVLGPVTLMVEDLHWADAATRELLLLLARNPPQELRLLLTYRRQDLPGDGNVLGTPYRRPPGTGGVEITLTTLTEEEVGRLAASAVGPAATRMLRRQLHERSGGLPLLVEEDLLAIADRLAREGGSPVAVLEEVGVPRALREAVSSRVAVLSERAVAAVQAAAVLAVPAGEEVLALLAGQEEEQAEAALVEALEASVLVELSAGRYGFRHALARQAVYEGIVGPRRRRLHLRAIAVLQGRERTALVQIAHHARRLGDTSLWMSKALAAADHAVTVGDDGVAADLYQQLLAEPALPSADRVQSARSLGRIALARTDPVASAEVLSRIVADQALPAAVRGEIRLALGRNLVGVTAERNTAELNRALDELDHPVPVAIAMATLGQGYRPDVPVTEDQALIERAERIVTEADDDLALVTVRAAGTILMAVTGDPRVYDLLNSLPHDSPDRGIRLQCVRALHYVAWYALLHGHTARAQALRDETAQVGRREGYQLVEHSCAVLQLYLDLAAGRWDGLEQRTEAILQESPDGTLLRHRVVLVRVMLDAARGRWAGARMLLAAMDAEGAQSTAWQVGHEVAAQLAHLDLLEGDPQAAWGRLGPSLAARRAKGVWVSANGLVPVAVQVALACGLREEAERLTDEAAHGIEGRDSPGAQAEVLLCRALLATATDPEAALAHAVQAAARYEGTGRIHSTARATELLGQLQLARSGAGMPDQGTPDPENLAEEGVRNIRSALDVFTRLGATIDASRCQRSLRDLGRQTHTPTGRRGYGSELSPREQQVAELLATGATNHDIAGALVLSTRTVENHVASVLRKLGVNRAQIQAAPPRAGF
ncbi:helix-turn-helix transcriptional regulator [Kitasatospora sp. NPDC001574]